MAGAVVDRISYRIELSQMYDSDKCLRIQSEWSGDRSAKEGGWAGG